MLGHRDEAQRPAGLDLPGYRLHMPKGEFKGMWSISISGNWQIVFRFTEGDVYDVDLVDYHWKQATEQERNRHDNANEKPAASRTLHQRCLS